MAAEQRAAALKQQAATAAAEEAQLQQQAAAAEEAALAAAVAVARARWQGLLAQQSDLRAQLATEGEGSGDVGESATRNAH